MPKETLAPKGPRRSAQGAALGCGAEAPHAQRTLRPGGAQEVSPGRSPGLRRPCPRIRGPVFGGQGFAARPNLAHALSERRWWGSLGSPQPRGDGGMGAPAPRASPWAAMLCPFGACGPVGRRRSLRTSCAENRRCSGGVEADRMVACAGEPRRQRRGSACCLAERALEKIFNTVNKPTMSVTPPAIIHS